MKHQPREEDDHHTTTKAFMEFLRLRPRSVGKRVMGHREEPLYLDKEKDVHYFGSRSKMPGALLSNFAEAKNPFETPSMPGRKFTNSEAAWMVYRVHESDRDRFARGGDLSTLEEGAPKVFDKDVEKKKGTWGPQKKTGKPAMPGVIAKMAVKEKRMKKLGLTPGEGKPDLDTDAYIDQVAVPRFGEILVNKYGKNPEMLSALLATGDKHLVEFNKGAERNERKANPPLWTGLISTTQVDDQGRGKLCGDNLQGEIQMLIRAFFRREQRATES